MTGVCWGEQRERLIKDGDMEIKKTNKYFFLLKCFEMLLCSKYLDNKDFVHSGSIGLVLGMYARYVIYILLYPKLLIN